MNHSEEWMRKILLIMIGKSSEELYRARIQTARLISQQRSCYGRVRRNQKNSKSSLRYTCKKMNWGNEVRWACFLRNGAKAKDWAGKEEWAKWMNGLNVKWMKGNSVRKSDGLWKWEGRLSWPDKGNLKRRHWRCHAVWMMRMDLTVYVRKRYETPSWFEKVLWKIWCWASFDTRIRSIKKTLRGRGWEGKEEKEETKA